MSELTLSGDMSEDAAVAYGNLHEAASAVRERVSGKPGEWRFDGKKLSEEAALDLLSLVGYVNDVEEMMSRTPHSEGSIVTGRRFDALESRVGRIEMKLAAIAGIRR